VAATGDLATLAINAMQLGVIFVGVYERDIKFANPTHRHHRRTHAHRHERPGSDRFSWELDVAALGRIRTAR
jgi:hypothetical protein